jgi:uncharacterized membrane protein
MPRGAVSEVLLFVYDGERTAAGVLGELCDRRPELAGSLLSSGVVSVARDGRYSVSTTDWPGSGSPFWGMLWEALFGLVFLVPTPGSAYGSNLGALFGAIERAGIDEELRGRIRESLGPRTSGLAMILPERNPDLEADLQRAHGATVIEASLSLEQDSELANELGGIIA